MTKGNEMTLRQQLRQQAEAKLEQVRILVVVAVDRAMQEAGVDLDGYDVMRMCVGSHTKTVKAKLITELANSAEAALIKMWNDQQSLGLEEKSE